MFLRTLGNGNVHLVSNALKAKLIRIACELLDLAEELMWSLPMQLPKGQPRNVEVVDGLVWSDLTSP